jgi:hypothetical protein
MQPQRAPSWFDIFLMPVMILAQAPAWMIFAVIFVISGLCTLAYYSLNSDFFGLAAPPYDSLTFSADFSSVRAQDERTWNISYETNIDRTFTGVVRHVSHWREDSVPFATHDVLVTTEEFASPARVSTNVRDHVVYYRYRNPRPQGTLNLLHIVPASVRIYRQLLEVREWNLVRISGREIFRIDMFNRWGDFLGYWQDAGCNSILVKSVTIQAKGTPIP